MCSRGVSDPLCFSAPQPRSNASAFAAAASRQLPCILLTSPSFRSCVAVSCSVSDASFRNRRSFVVVSAANGSALMANSTPSKDGVHTVSDCMTKKDDLLVVKPSTTVEEALEIIVENRISGLPVVDDDWKLVGVVSDYDLLALDSVSGSGKTDGSIFPEADSNWKVFNELQRLLSKTNGTLISDVMTVSPLCVRESTNVEDSARYHKWYQSTTIRGRERAAMGVSNRQRIEALEAGMGEVGQRMSGLEATIQKVLTEGMATLQKTLAESFAAKGEEEHEFGTELAEDLALQTDGRGKEIGGKMDGKRLVGRWMGEGSNSEGIPTMEESYSIAVQKLQIEEFTGALQTLVWEAACESTNHVGVVGLRKSGKIEPTFLLVMDGAERGFKPGPAPEYLGPPPWYEASGEKLGPIVFFMLEALKAAEKWGVFHDCLGPFSWPNSTFENALGKHRLYGPTSRIPYNSKEVANLIKGNCLLQPPFQPTKCNHQITFVLPMWPPTRPPPQPPDRPAHVSGPDFYLLNTDTLIMQCPTSMLAAAADPSDHQSFLFITFDFKHGLEDKAALIGSVRSWLLTKEGSLVEVWDFRQPPPESPPWPPRVLDVLDYFLVQLSIFNNDPGGGEFSTLNRFDEVCSYGAFGCLFQPSTILFRVTMSCPRRGTSCRTLGLLFMESIGIWRGIYNGSAICMRMPRSIDLLYHSPRPPELALVEEDVKKGK